MPELPEQLSTGWWYEQSGELERAERNCREFLAAQPDHPDGLFLLGIVCLRTGRARESAESFDRVTILKPDYAAAHGNLGAALTELGRLDEAVTSLCRAIELKPDEADSHSNLGTALARKGRLDEAAEAFREAVRLRPKFVEAIANLGAALAKLGRFDEAVAQYRRALELKPNHAETHNNIGSLLLRMLRPADAEEFLRKATQINPRYAEAHNNLGLAMVRQHKVDDAVRLFEQAAELRPDYADAWRNLGIARARLGDWQAAADALRRALDRKPNSIASLVWLGKALGELGRIEEAEDCYRRAIELEPSAGADAFADLFVPDAGVAAFTDLSVPDEDLPAGTAMSAGTAQLVPAPTRANQVAAALIDFAHMLSLRAKPDEALRELEKARELNPNDPFTINKMGAVLWSLRRYDEATACFDAALRIKPDYADAHLNRSHYFLMQGDFAAGFEEYDWRLKIKSYFPDAIPEPCWNGEPLDGRPIVLHHEQGLGDMLMMLRFVPLVKERGGRVIYKCLPPLRGLLAGFASIDELVAPDAPESSLPPDAVHVAMMSLPRVFGARADRVPGCAPFLAPDPVLVQYWRRELERFPGTRIGIVWQGSPRYVADRERSIPLRAFAPLASIEGVQLFSLQKGHGSEQMQNLPDGMRVIDLGRWLDERGQPFVDTAAVMCGLDLVIVADTSIGHLAGALGVPVWLALAAAADWRWMLDRDDTPWYPTMRLWRQRTPGDWDNVFERMADELDEFPPPRRGIDAIPIGVSPGELIDRVTILRIKCQRLSDGAARGRAHRQLQSLEAALSRACPTSPDLDRLADQLAAVNERLWQLEGAIRACERRGDFGPQFIELARSVYRLNDERARLKRAIDELHGSPLSDEKQYEPYD